MKKTNALKLRSILAVALMAVIGLAACNNGNLNTPLSAPTGLTATAVSSTEIGLIWNQVSGAAGYNVYNSANGILYSLLGTTTTTSASNYNLSPSTTYYYKVAAYSSNGTEGYTSDAVSATTLAPNSLNGLWVRNGDGMRINVSGSTGSIIAIGSMNYWSDALSKSHVSIGGSKFRYLSNTGTLTWSGDELLCNISSSNSNISNGTSWGSCTITMSADGNTISTYTPTSSTPQGTWRRTSGSGSYADPFKLASNIWDGNNLTSSNNLIYYTFNVTYGTTYRVWWNDSYNSEGTKTVDVKVSAYYSNGVEIFSDIDTAWSSAYAFTASYTGSVKLKVIPYSNGTGTFGIVYSTNSTRPSTTQ